MSMFHTEPGDDVECPRCGAKYAIRWGTEYGEPILGEHDDAWCGVCDKDFSFGVWITYTQARNAKGKLIV